MRALTGTTGLHVSVTHSIVSFLCAYFSLMCCIFPLAHFKILLYVQRPRCTVGGSYPADFI